MKKILLIFLFVPCFLFGQSKIEEDSCIITIQVQANVDTIINTGIYKSYFCYSLKEPLYVAYKLYNGGGTCKREAFHFKNDTKITTATQTDYDKNGYDEGHLADAKDFSFDCIKEELTFRFYNCLPQTANLNRGIWKEWETTIRKESQKDSLQIICGGVFSNTMIGNKVYVPIYCWKIVYSLTTNQPKYILWFTNTMTDNTVIILDTLDELKKLINYDLKY